MQYPLQFQAIGDKYELDQGYQVSLFNEPQMVIDGGGLTHDLTWHVRSAPLFGIEPIRVYQLSPATTVTGRLTRFTIRGAQLDQATSITLNDLAIDGNPNSDAREPTGLRYRLAKDNRFNGQTVNATGGTTKLTIITWNVLAPIFLLFQR